MPSHFLAHWHHDLGDEPIRLYEELDDDRKELRKIEEFGDGRLVRTDSFNDFLPSLSSHSVPDLAEIEADPEFSVEPMTLEAFEEVWARASDAP